MTHQPGRTYIVVGTLIMALLALTGCGLVLGRTQQAYQTAVIVTGTPHVSIETFNGNIEVTTGAADKVSAGVIESAADDTDFDRMEFNFSQEGLNVRGKCAWSDPNKPSNATCDLNIQVPAGSDVELVTGNGTITYKAVPGKTLKAAVGNGNVNVTLPRDAQFPLDAAVGHGKIKSGFDLGDPDAAQKQHVTGAVGDQPDLSVALRIGNGDITIEPAR